VPQRVLVLHHAAAELDHRDLVAKAADPAQRLDQRVRFLNRLEQGSRSPRTLPVELAPTELNQPKNGAQ